MYTDRKPHNEPTETSMSSKPLICPSRTLLTVARAIAEHSTEACDACRDKQNIPNREHVRTAANI